MDLQLYTWNSLAINDSNPFVAIFPPGQKANLSASAITVNRAGDFPFLSTRLLNPPVLIIEVYIAPAADIDTNRELLKKYFNITDETRHNLIARDADDSNKQYYVTGFPIQIAPLGSAPKNGFTVRFQIEYPYWQLVTAASDAWAITGTGDTQAITNAGNIKVPPVFTFTPTTTKSGGLSYRRYVAIKNNLDKSFIAPLDLTNGGLDTATLTTAKMQADGDDFRVWEDGSFADRWLYDMDTAATKCWKNSTYAARKYGTLGTTINASVQTLAFSQTRANLQFLRALKSTINNTLMIESELLTFDPDNVDVVNYQITSVGRGAKTSTAASHTAPITVSYIEHDTWILYGDSTLTTPDVDDDYKPIFSLSSTNGVWSYTEFYDADSNRSGMWLGGVQASRTGLSYAYTSDENSFSDPADEMGMSLINFDDNRVQFETGIIAWMISHPSGITDVTYSGKKYVTDVSWASVAGLQYLQPNTAWLTASNQAIPAVPLTWEVFGPVAVALGGTYETIRFALDGSMNPINNDQIFIQFDTVSLTFASANLPTITLLAEQTINFFDFKVTNNTTGEWLKVTTPCPVNTALTVDCENKEAYLADGTRVNVTLSSDRENWLDLAAGSNTLQFDDTGTVAVTGVVGHRDRVL